MSFFPGTCGRSIVNLACEKGPNTNLNTDSWSVVESVPHRASSFFLLEPEPHFRI
jgi:hypothetical protein